MESVSQIHPPIKNEALGVRSDPSRQESEHTEKTNHRVLLWRSRDGLEGASLLPFLRAGDGGVVCVPRDAEKRTERDIAFL